MAMSLRTALTDSRASAIPHAFVRPSIAGVWALGRIEARRMLLHQAFLVGLGFALLLLRGAFGRGGSAIVSVENLAWLIGGVLFGGVVGTIFAANVASLRPRRDHVQELFGALPAPPETRTAGLFAGLFFGPVAISILLTAAGYVVFGDYEKTAANADLFLAAQIPLTVATLGAIGITVGRWIPSLLGGVLIVAAHMFTGIIWLVPWIQPTSSGILRSWHMVYLVAAFTTWVALALARDRRTLWRFAIAGSAFALGVYAAVQQVPRGGFR